MAKFKKLAVFVLFFSFSWVQAETITAKRISSTLRFIPLKKMTVGPDDQYHGTVDPSGELLAFTRKSDLIPHLCSQNVNTGEVTDLLPLTSDSQEPAISPDGEVAFTYFKFHAGGDICHKPLRSSKGPEEKVVCLKIETGEPSTPFWKSSKELGYLLKDNWKQNNKIVVENLDTGSKETLAEGKIWSPSMKPGGRYLFYNSLEGTERVLVLKDLKSNQTKIVRFALPGISGFPAVSDDEKYLFFSHYLNDTNNDNVIDGNDNSVIFRTPIETLLTQDIVFPEQLTSVESNCSFPRPFKDVIYATCAFEGALDIYQLPMSGIVPASWDESVLNNAHDTSRTYSERILVLNTLKYRFPQKSNSSLEERILSNHIMADDLASSKYYLQHVKANANAQLKDFYTLLKIYLDARELKKIQKSNEVSPSFEDGMIQAGREIEKVPGYPRLKKILKGLLQTFLNQPLKSVALLKEVRFDSVSLPLERYFFFELANWTFPRIKSVEGLSDAYRQMMSAPEFSEETQLYYAFRYLQGLQTGKYSMNDRLDRIRKMSALKTLTGPVASLLKSEEVTLRLINSNEEGKSQVYGELDRLMSASRSDYFLRKAAYIRSILNFAEAQEFKYLNFIASNWLNYTQNNDTEFANAREVFAFANLDQAYSSLGKKNSELAGNYFFSSLTLTDDLESHYGYILAKVAKDQRAILDVRYKNLRDHQQIEDNMKFVEALLLLVDAHPKSRDDVKHLDLAMEKLKTMEQDRDSAVRYLLMGYCSMEKLFRLGAGYVFDQGLFENAHRDLMLAYDQGLDNDRVRASALMNLGLLHQRVQNHGLAAKFFLKRKELGFMSDEEAARLAWFYAKSLYYNHQPDQAVGELQSVLKNLPDKWKPPLQERLGFYFLSGGKYSEAVQSYEQLFKSKALEGDLNLAKTYLSYGFSLYKLKREKEARAALERSLDAASRLQPIPKGSDRWIDFQPVRLKLVAYGLLGKFGSNSQRLEALQKRNVYLKDSKQFLDGWLTTYIQNELQLAYLWDRVDSVKAALELNEALKSAEELGDSSQYLANSVHHATVDFLIHAIRNPKLYGKQNSSQIQKVVEKSIQAYDSQKTIQPLLEYQKIKLKMLWLAYSGRIMGLGATQQKMQELSDSESLKQLKESMPDKWKELQSLAKIL